MLQLVTPEKSSSQIEDDMPLRNEDKQWVRDEIAAAIKAALDAFRPQGWRKAALFIREWGLVATVIIIPLTLLGMLITVGIFAANGITKNAQFQGTTEQRLLNIEKTLTTIQQDLATQKLATHAFLSSVDFKNTLPDLASTVGSLRVQNVKVNPTVLNGVGERLSAVADTNTPGFWDATAQFISYRSEVNLNEPRALFGPDLPNCTDLRPAGMIVQKVTPHPNGQTNVKVENAKYSNCRVTLDSPEDDDKLNSILQHQASKITFTNCLIVYRGGAINLILEFKNDRRFVRTIDQTGRVHKLGQTVVSGPTMEFEKCLFDFNINGKPNTYGQQLAEALLQQGGPKIILPSPVS